MRASISLAYLGHILHGRRLWRGDIPVKVRLGINVLPAGEQGKVRYSYCGKISSYIGACIERIPALV